MNLYHVQVLRNGSELTLTMAPYRAQRMANAIRVGQMKHSEWAEEGQTYITADEISAESKEKLLAAFPVGTVPAPKTPIDLANELGAKLKAYDEIKKLLEVVIPCPDHLVTTHKATVCASCGEVDWNGGSLTSKMVLDKIQALIAAAESQ